MITNSNSIILVTKTHLATKPEVGGRLAKFNKKKNTRYTFPPLYLFKVLVFFKSMTKINTAAQYKKMKKINKIKEREQPVNNQPLLKTDDKAKILKIFLTIICSITGKIEVKTINSIIIQSFDWLTTKKGKNFCQVISIKDTFQLEFSTILTNQKWKGAEANLIIIDEVNKILNQKVPFPISKWITDMSKIVEAKDWTTKYFIMLIESPLPESFLPFNLIEVNTKVFTSINNQIINHETLENTDTAETKINE